ncbi:MAG: platelet-activating factor acetylhydrolase IB subunit [Planctomycetia bacterium]|nr:platelet-activating factor acetylhydrolase IB subunit [Planctomycetia bacterium]
MRRPVSCWLLALLACLSVVCPSPVSAAEAPAHDAVTAVPREEDWWTERQELINSRTKEQVDLLFIGDSITHGWEGDGKDVWAKYFAPRHAMNAGIGGDRTQHVLWRLQNGNLEGIQPKLAVLMIGTNNSNGEDNTATEIADGIKAIVTELRTKTPETKVLVLAIFPRGDKPNPQRDKISEVNKQVAAWDQVDGKNVIYFDFGDKFLAADGSLPADIMPDFLHLSPKGYEIWAEAIEPQLAEIVGPK